MRYVLLMALLAASCGGKPRAASGGGGGVVARIDGQPITVADVEERIGKLDPYSRARFSSPEQKKKWLENLVTFEMLAKEAQRKGYDRDPDVQRVVKNQMVSALLQKELDDKMKAEVISDADVDRFYREHEDSFKQKEEVRVSQIFSVDGGKADRAAAEARAPKGMTEKAFRDLVDKYSEDEDSKGRGGDLTFFARDNATLPRTLVDAAFAMKNIGDVAGPIHSDKGFHVIKLTQRRPAFTRPREQVAAEIRRLILRDRRAKKTEQMVAEMRQRLKVEVYEDQLAKVVVP